jgi:hypothetical protein
MVGGVAIPSQYEQNSEIPVSQRSSHLGMCPAITLVMRRADHLLTPLVDSFQAWDAIRVVATLIIVIALMLVLSLRA